MHVVCDLDYHQEPLVDSIQPLNCTISAYYLMKFNYNEATIIVSLPGPKSLELNISKGCSSDSDLAHT